MYDIVFISYQEPNADENFERLRSRFSTAKRVHGVKGIHQAHIAAAKKCFTKMFWVVDGDAVVLDSFNFDHEVDEFNLNSVHVWRSTNPVNDLIYGYGGVKLLPRKMTLSMDVSTPDMTTSISRHFKSMPQISNITAFNTDPFSTWRSAFRECAKLSSQSIDRQITAETLARLKIWCSSGVDRPYGKYAIAGALAGRSFGETHPTELHKINDFDWLKEQFDATS